MPAPTLGNGVRDVLQRVGGAGVLCDEILRVVHLAALAIHGNVLQHAAKADGVVDLGLPLFGEVDGLGVAAPLEVEDALVGPAMLVVPDKAPLRVGGERGLAGPGESEEE